MKFNSAVILSSILAVAVAQDSSSTTSSATTTASLSPQASCAAKCTATDICCIAACYEVPCPNNSQVNDTTSCVAACPQGSGSASDQKAYASCESSCVSSYFLATATGASGSSATKGSSSDASTTKSGSSSTSTGSSSKSGSKSGSSSDSTGTATGTSAHASSTENAAAIAQLKLGVSAAGVLGFVLAAWAL
ncbi:hypothetical protein BO70DRAFT_214527 [Aspergillus heteromorphus CBS 117.55]|uniref:Extracellular membrane protein CFEM domain-containing protein n=1 Tax=Aspergillus heteromorphus CBS 117.55 TaxID=1448321 RepID=A0A317WLQ5_9EURO|nr:uncharacterized protein BO70DRAFT_214527 [Aspergillus heteromorphus CBS 117.55]PWY86955.1 hypothetical protein BO70DRAFT_214527 [Aspergillus heteromorphus CBS 117.55]